MAEDELLKSKNILPPDDENASRQIGPALLKLAGQLQPQVGPIRCVGYVTDSFDLARIHFVCKQQLHQSASFAHVTHILTPTQEYILPK